MENESHTLRLFPPDRVMAFSDGVFAIVITLVVLAIDVPPVEKLTAAELLSVRDKMGHQLLVYFVSFWFVGLYWSQHSLLFGSLHKIDRGMTVLNLLFLLPVTLLPFVTELMGVYRDDWRAILVFGAINLWAILSLRWLWRHLAACPEMHKGPVTLALGQRVRRRSLFFSAIIVLGVITSLVDIKAALLMFLLIPAGYFYTHLRAPSA